MWHPVDTIAAAHLLHPVGRKMDDFSITQPMLLPAWLIHQKVAKNLLRQKLLNDSRKELILPIISRLNSLYFYVMFCWEKPVRWVVFVRRFAVIGKNKKTNGVLGCVKSFTTRSSWSMTSPCFDIHKGQQRQQETERACAAQRPAGSRQAGSKAK